MKIVIAGQDYAFVHPIQASPAQLLALHRTSGLTFEDIQGGIDDMNALSALGLSEQEATAKFLSNPSILIAMGALVFLAKWGAGERPTFEEACDVPIYDVAIVSEPGDEAEAQVPEVPALPASAPGGNRAARRSATRSPSSRSTVKSEHA